MKKPLIGSDTFARADKRLTRGGQPAHHGPATNPAGDAAPAGVPRADDEDGAASRRARASRAAGSSCCMSRVHHREDGGGGREQALEARGGETRGGGGAACPAPAVLPREQAHPLGGAVGRVVVDENHFPASTRRGGRPGGGTSSPTLPPSLKVGTTRDSSRGRSERSGSFGIGVPAERVSARRTHRVHAVRQAAPVLSPLSSAGFAGAPAVGGRRRKGGEAPIRAVTASRRSCRRRGRRTGGA